MSHADMFQHYETKGEVYKKLLSDFRSEERKVGIAITAAICGLLFGLSKAGSASATFAFSMAGLSAFYGLIYFIDLSNRNFALHIIDWIEADKRNKR